MCDKRHKISNIKCDASIKQKDDSDETEQFVKITAMQTLRKILQLTGESSIKKKRPVRVSTLQAK
jgi:predicted DNA binding CopG/RHH family protein